jgi:hypothetical protein
MLTKPRKEDKKEREMEREKEERCMCRLVA